MIAMLGLTMAGAGLMKSESARKKQDELAKQDALANIALATALTEQKESAEENWAENQTMQANAQQSVMTEVTQSEANRQFWVEYAIWEQKVAEAEAKRQAQQQTATTGGMFPPGSTVEDLPPHLQKLFWELGNMHFEKDEDGGWRFSDDRGELGYHQYLIRQALKNGDNEALTAHFQSANQWIDKSLTGWINNEMETTANSLISKNKQEQQKAFHSVNPQDFNGKYKDAPKKYYQEVEGNLKTVTTLLSLQSQAQLNAKAEELHQDLVKRQREYLVSAVVTALSREVNRVEQGLQYNQTQLLSQAKATSNTIIAIPPKSQIQFNRELGNTPTPPPNTDEYETVIAPDNLIPEISQELIDYILLKEPNGCDGDESSRSICTLERLAILNDYFGEKNGRGRMTYEELLAIVIMTEIGDIYGKAIERDENGVPTNYDTSYYIRTGDGSLVDSLDANTDPINRTRFLRLARRSVILNFLGFSDYEQIRLDANTFAGVERMLRDFDVDSPLMNRFTDGQTMTDLELIFWLSGVIGDNGDHRVSGIQGIYGFNVDDLTTIPAGADETTFELEFREDYKEDARFVLDLYLGMNRDANGQLPGCLGCTWGEIEPSVEQYFVVKPDEGDYGVYFTLQGLSDWHFISLD